MKNNTPKYFVEAFWKDGTLEYSDFCYSVRNMIACVKRALADGFFVKITTNETK